MAFFGKSKRNIQLKNDSQTNSMARALNESPNLPSPKAIIYKSELDFISRCILDYPNIETGGELFGFWTQLGTPIVMYAVGPGPRAIHNQTSFIQDPNYVDNIEVEICNRTGLQHIGQWHSHHQLSLAQPSGGDVASMQRGVGLPGFPRMLLCIGNCTNTHSTVNAFNFHENTPGRYSEAFWDVINIDSPFRSVIDGLFKNSLYVPRTHRASHGEMRIITKGTFSQGVKSQHWLTENVENVETMKSFVSKVQSMYPAITVKAEILESGEPLIVLVEKDISIKLPYGFPVKSPILISSAEENLSYANNWETGEEPLNVTFGRWIASVLPNIICDLNLTSEASDENVYGSSKHKPLTKEEKMEYRIAKTRIKRIALENQVLSYYFHKAAFAWSDITDTPVVNIVAYPFTKGKQCVVRMTLPYDFPENEPSVQIGYYCEDDTPEPTLPEHLSEINYIRLSELFNGAKGYYSRMLNWTKDSSLLRAYIVACTIIFYSNKAKKEGCDVDNYLNQYLDNDSKMKDLIKNISEKIKAQKQ